MIEQSSVDIYYSKIQDVLIINAHKKVKLSIKAKGTGKRKLEECLCWVTEEL
jgi:hypothetical protein